MEILADRIGRYTPLCFGGNICYVTSAENGRINYWNGIPLTIKDKAQELYLLKLGYIREWTKNFVPEELEKHPCSELDDVTVEKKHQTV